MRESTEWRHDQADRTRNRLATKNLTGRGAEGIDSAYRLKNTIHEVASATPYRCVGFVPLQFLSR